MKNQVKALKVKIKSLAAEAQIIRLEEGRVLGRKKPDLQLYRSLREHRIRDVRGEQRSSLIAYGYIRGRAYSAVEKPSDKNPPDWSRVRSLVEKFGSAPGHPVKCLPEALTEWAKAVSSSG